VMTKKGCRRSGKIPDDDLVNGGFTGPASEKVWLTDIVEHPTTEGKFYACCIEDVFSNRIVGDATGEHMTAEPAVSALRQAVDRPDQAAPWWPTAMESGQFRSRASRAVWSQSVDGLSFKRRWRRRGRYTRMGHQLNVGRDHHFKWTQVIDVDAQHFVGCHSWKRHPRRTTFAHPFCGEPPATVNDQSSERTATGSAFGAVLFMPAWPWWKAGEDIQAAKASSSRQRVTTSHWSRPSVGRRSSKPSKPSWWSTAPARAAKRRASSSPLPGGTVMALILMTVTHPI
jgi:hypothetical protein